MKRRPTAPLPLAPPRPACDSRLGFGLYLAYAMSHLNMPEDCVEIDLSTADLQAASPGLIGTLCYCREHGLTGAA